MKRINGVEVCDCLEEMIAPARTAVISVDLQNDFCHPDGHFGRHGKDLSLTLERLPTMVSFVQKSQAVGIPVIFIRQVTLPGGHSDSPAWLRFKTRDGKDPNYTLPGTFGWDFVDGLEPSANDSVVEKTRPDAFLNTPLERVLRGRGIETLVILGVNTEGCVESTVRSASYLDYYTVVVEDALGSPNHERHEASLGFYRARYPLHRAEEILTLWRSQARFGAA
ncbi:isochorismatase family cysteine hydrolase [Algihabitans albus]|uniref:isochorismatase family cysteine hydrolase n=1 Tax=Algihabitans albus TaxID=2164067 RepID=UPI000E5D167D|nr:isochorismatase family cysteine hydrolase [Algihabitans albus]